MGNATQEQKTVIDGVLGKLQVDKNEDACLSLVPRPPESWVERRPGEKDEEVSPSREHEVVAGAEDVSFTPKKLGKTSKSQQGPAKLSVFKKILAKTNSSPASPSTCKKQSKMSIFKRILEKKDSSPSQSQASPKVRTQRRNLFDFSSSDEDRDVLITKPKSHKATQGTSMASLSFGFLSSDDEDALATVQHQAPVGKAPRKQKTKPTKKDKPKPCKPTPADSPGERNRVLSRAYHQAHSKAKRDELSPNTSKNKVRPQQFY